MRKSQIWISAVLYVLIIVIAIAIILTVVQPLFQKMQDKTKFSQSKETMLALDNQIIQVAGEGAGSQRVVPIEIGAGNVELDNESITHKLETKSKVVEPRSQVEFGNLIISSGKDVKGYETNNSYVLENSKIKAEFLKGNFTDKTRIIRNITLLENNVTTDITIDFAIDIIYSLDGNTTLLDKGDNLAKARVLATITDPTPDYQVMFTLESEADYIKVEYKGEI